MGSLKELKKQSLVIEEFLPNLQYYLTEIYNIPMYEQEEHNKKFNTKSNFPGKRSNSLFLENKFLFFLILQNLKKVSFLKKYSVNIFLHLRRNEDFFKDWIHKDNDDYAFLIYLNETNLNSGTYLYDENNNIISDFKYVQNRFVIYNGDYNHMGYGHFGNLPENGRLTINGFLKINDE
jgi:hypothetical protein